MPQTKKQQTRRKAKKYAKHHGLPVPFTAKRQNGAKPPDRFGH